MHNKKLQGKYVLSRSYTPAVEECLNHYHVKIVVLFLLEVQRITESKLLAMNFVSLLIGEIELSNNELQFQWKIYLEMFFNCNNIITSTLTCIMYFWVVSVFHVHFV